MQWYIFSVFETAAFVTNEAGQRVMSMWKQ
jgi:hypothetical protein